MAEPQPVELPPALDEPREVPTPGLTTVDEVKAALGVPAGALIKAMPVIVNERMVLALVRGDHRLNELKLRSALGADFRPAHPEEIAAELGPAGFIGPVGAEVPVLKDAAIQGEGFVCGANKPDAHLIGVAPGQGLQLRGGRHPLGGGGRHRTRRRPDRDRARDRGREHLQARHPLLGGARRHLPRRAGEERPIVMGSYGIGPARVVAAAIEQGADDKGIVWPRSIAPWDVHLVGLGKADDETMQAADALYGELRDAGAEVVYDDRDAGPGEKLTDAELLGCPLRLVVGKRGSPRGRSRHRPAAAGRPSASRSRSASRAPSSCSMASTRKALRRWTAPARGRFRPAAASRFAR